MGRLSAAEWCHTGIWVALAFAAYLTAGPYAFASCWVVLPLLMWPLRLMLFAFAAVSLIVLTTAPFRKPLQGCHRAGVHITILTLGLLSCFIAADVSVGNVSCL
jgi:hypothetical protein